MCCEGGTSSHLLTPIYSSASVCLRELSDLRLHRPCEISSTLCSLSDSGLCPWPTTCWILSPKPGPRWRWCQCNCDDVYSPALTAALKDIATQVPSLKKDIQNGLLHVLSMVLMGRPLRRPGAPKQPPVTVPVTGWWIDWCYDFRCHSFMLLHRCACVHRCVTRQCRDCRCWRHYVGTAHTW